MFKAMLDRKYLYKCVIAGGILALVCFIILLGLSHKLKDNECEMWKNKYEEAFDIVCSDTGLLHRQQDQLNKDKTLLEIDTDLIKQQNKHLDALLPLAFEQIERDMHIDEAFLTKERQELLFRLLDCLPELNKDEGLEITKTDKGFVVRVIAK